MTLIFFGTPEFASRCLGKILLSRHQVAAVVSAPDRPRGRGKKLAQPEVKKLALEHGLEILQPVRLKDPQFLKRLGSISADLFCVVAFRILPDEVFSMPPRGCVNLHASLLPRYRGAAPINWALINGDQETGLTTFFIRREIDTGDMILQEKIAIGPDETAGELHDRMADLGGDMLVKTMDLIESGNFSLLKQNSDKVTPAPKLSPELGRIDWEKTAKEIHNLIRGLSPRPGAFAYFNDKRVTLLRSKFIDDNPTGKAAGEVILSDPKAGIIVACGRGKILVIEIKPESGKAMTGADFVRGYRLKNGDYFKNRSISSDKVGI